MVSEAMVVYYIDDTDQTLSFYKNALGLVTTSESPGWSTLRVTEGFELALHARFFGGSTAPEKHPFDTGEPALAVSVDDLEAYCKRITAHGGSLDRILEPRQGIPVRTGLVRDPSGNGFQVNQYVG